MKILIDGQTLLTPEIGRGIGKYFVQCIENVLHYDFINEFFLNTPSGPHVNVLSNWTRTKLQFLHHKAYDIRSGNDPNHLQHSYSEALNNDLEKFGIDLYWSPNGLMHNVVLPNRVGINCKYAVTIFDLIPTVFEKQYAKQWPASSIADYQERLKRLEKDFDLYLHISQQTQSDFLKTLNVNHKRNIVTPLGVDSSFRPAFFPDAPAAFNYVLYPGGFDPRKNMERAVEAFADLHSRYGHDPTVSSLQLWIVCHSSKASETRLLAHARRCELDGKVFLTGFVDDRKLVELYQKARCLFFPSLYEGFGLPLLEGLACGLPVAASNTSSLPEVGGDFSVYFNPYVVSEMADGLYEALQLPVDHESRQKRFEYASGFSWKNTAITTLNGFNDLVTASEVNEEESDLAPDRDFINVRRRMSEVSIEELCETAERFFSRLDNWDYLHAKPFAAVAETPELLSSFAQVVYGLNLLPDMTILDFGAGSCWTSRFLSQLGMEVIAVDVSATALKIGEALYKRYPLVGNQPEPRFLQFNGRKLELPAESVDRISCWDAFHHVPNPAHVLKEMARVLKSGGIAGFSEPGPEHSKTPQSQYEMRTNQLIENDIVMSEIWFAAQAAGFTDIKLAMFNPKPTLVPMDRFDAYLNGEDGEDSYLAESRQEMQHRRLFFLYKGESDAQMDSRQREGLGAKLRVDLSAGRIEVGNSVLLHVTVTNTGSSIWLPGEARVGGVRFGIHLFDENERLLDLDYFRHSLTGDPARRIVPGETTEFTAELPMTSKGVFILECDLVSEGICWFEHNGSPTVKLGIVVT